MAVLPSASESGRRLECPRAALAHREPCESPPISALQRRYIRDQSLRWRYVSRDLRITRALTLKLDRPLWEYSSCSSGTRGNSRRPRRCRSLHLSREQWWPYRRHRTAQLIQQAFAARFADQTLND